MAVFIAQTFVTSPVLDAVDGRVLIPFGTQLLYTEFAGNYTYIDSSLIFNPESDTTCTEYFNWNSDVSFFRDSLSLCHLGGYQIYILKNIEEM